MHGKAHLPAEFPQAVDIPRRLCAKPKIAAAEHLSGVEQLHQHLPAERFAVQGAEFRKRRAVYAVDAAVLHQFRFLGISIEVGQRHALLDRDGICRKGECTRHQPLRRRTLCRSTQHSTVSQMNTVKKSQRHGTFLCQRCSDAPQLFQARFRLST